MFRSAAGGASLLVILSAAACARPPVTARERMGLPPVGGDAAAEVSPEEKRARATLGLAYRTMQDGKTLPALRIFDRAIEEAQVAKAPHVVALAQAFAGLCLDANRRGDEARIRFERAIAATTKPTRATALAHEGLARQALAARRFEDAAERAVLALRASFAVGDLAGAGVAVDLLVQAVPIKDAILRADVLAATASIAASRPPAAVLGDVALRAGERVIGSSPMAARRRLRLAARLGSVANDDDLLSLALGGLGTLELRRGKAALAREMLTLADERARKSGKPSTRIRTGGNLAQVLRFGGDLAGARRLYTEALDLARSLGPKYEIEAGILVSNLARIADAAGDLQRALAGDLEALAIHRRTGPARALATDLSNLGATYLRMKRFDDAEKAFVEARALAEKERAYDVLEAILLNHGYLEKSRGKTARARVLYEAALAALRRAEVHFYEPVILSNLAWLDADDGRCDAAAPRFAAAAERAEQSGDLETGWIALYGQSTCAARGNDRARARALLDRGIALIEKQRAGLAAGARGNQFFTAKTHHLYRDAVDLALEDGDGAAAFALAERGRARTLFEALAGGRRLGGGASPALKEKLRAAQAEVAASERGVALAEVEGGVGPAGRALEEARRRADTLAEEARLGAKPRSVALALGLQAAQASLRDDEAILEIALLKNKVALFVVRKEKLKAIASPVAKSVMIGHVSDFRSAMLAAQSGRPGGRWKRALRELYAGLVAPVRDELAGAKRIYVVPSGVFNLLPFGALLDGDKALFETFAVATLPSASVLAHVRRPMPKAPRFVAAGNPTFSNAALAALPAAESEVKGVAELFEGAQAWTGAAAKESSVKEAATRADILHLATHGEPNLRAPLFSALHFAAGDGDDGRLEVHEILRLELRAALIVLSACETAVQTGVGGGALPAGEELVGLVAALLEAGAASVLATLWRVADISTAKFAIAFYRALAKEGRAGALRAAQAEVRKQFPHPFYWAPFVLIGDGT